MLSTTYLKTALDKCYRLEKNEYVVPVKTLIHIQTTINYNNINSIDINLFLNIITCAAALSKPNAPRRHALWLGSNTWRSFLMSFTNCVSIQNIIILYRFVYNHRLRLVLFASRKTDSRTANVISTSIHTQFNRIITIIIMIIYPPRRRAASYGVIVILKTITRFWVLDRRRRFVSAFDSVWPHAAATPPKTHNEVFC